MELATGKLPEWPRLQRHIRAEIEKKRVPTLCSFSGIKKFAHLEHFTGITSHCHYLLHIVELQHLSSCPLKAREGNVLNPFVPLLRIVVYFRTCNSQANNKCTKPLKAFTDNSVKKFMR